MSSATKDVAMLRRGTLNSFETILKIDMDTPAEANSTGPTMIQKCKRDTDHNHLNTKNFWSTRKPFKNEPKRNKFNPIYNKRKKFIQSTTKGLGIDSSDYIILCNYLISYILWAD